MPCALLYLPISNDEIAIARQDMNIKVVANAMIQSRPRYVFFGTCSNFNHVLHVHKDYITSLYKGDNLRRSKDIGTILV